MSHASGQSSAFAGLNKSDSLTLILVRHSITALTEIGAFSGGSTPGPELTEVGLQMAERTAQVLADASALFGIEPPAVVESSPMVRAVQTAQPIAKQFDVPLVEDTRLREVALGEWEALTSGQIAERYPGQLKLWRAGEFAPPGGGESYAQVGERIGEVIDEWRTRYAGKCVVLVGHAAMIRTVIGRAMQMPPDTWANIRVPPCSISIVRYWPHSAELIVSGYPTQPPLKKA